MAQNGSPKQQKTGVSLQFKFLVGIIAFGLLALVLKAAGIL